MSTRYSAFNENREFFFTVNSQSEKAVSINMYGGEYTLIKTESGWVNSEKNKNKMAPGLINGVIRALGLS